MQTYETIAEVLDAMRKGEISKKNTITIDNDYVSLNLCYDKEGNEIEFETEEEYFEHEHELDVYSEYKLPREILIDVLNYFGFQAENC